MAQPSASEAFKPSITEEKSYSTTTTTSTVQELKSSDAATESQKPAPKIQGALPDLFLGALLPCVPVVLVTALLLTLIFRNRVNLDQGWPLLHAPTQEDIYDPNIFKAALQIKQSGGHPAYYIRFNPAVLAAIASWTSKIIPFITSSSMAVIAFFAGRRILNATRDKKPGELPTPHQMSILINLLGGADVKPLWDTFAYRLENHERLVQPIPLAASALSFIVIITLLIGAADTWFAASTKPMNVELLTRHLQPNNTFGRELNPAMCGGNIWEKRPCPSNSQTLCNYPCSIDHWNFTSEGSFSVKEGIKAAQSAAETLLGNSYVNQIQNTSYGAYQQAPQQYHYLADVGTGQMLDFMANTSAVSTQCKVATQDCQIERNKDGFSCYGYTSPSFTFQGDVGFDPAMAAAPSNMSATGIQFFKDAALQSPIGLGNQTTELFSVQNPIHFLTWSKGFPPIDTITQTFDAMKQGKYLQLSSSGDNIFILNCTASIYTTIYAWANGTILAANNTSGFYPTLASPDYGAIYSAPFAINSALGHLALQDAAALAAYKTTPQDMADKFADEFSRAAVALTAGIMQPSVNMLEQSRNNTELLTRVPKIPLYFLISLKAVYALGSVAVAVLAWVLTDPREAQEVKARLTVDGLMSGFLEPTERQEKAVEKVKEIYGEHDQSKTEEEKKEEVSKVGIQQTDKGGWVWVAGSVLKEVWTGFGVGGVVKGEVAGAVMSGKLG
ncbi:uncharacterized protein KY384_002894 [Bacidia gigantensis]|uniref:uncharacterized protein n=1 Tax=Bacidia gigantensis TaxID=2732470 RepID=UPI001D053929|nr:uncharacterized protein KY384_002894 [Bacidia gigantensis]KAG8532409.1 hypothetical protein KY384_002894 [Bacidia gigantensis]